VTEPPDQLENYAWEAVGAAFTRWNDLREEVGVPRQVLPRHVMNAMVEEVLRVWAQRMKDWRVRIDIVSTKEGT
jgi:hypothetical protein